MGRAPCCEKRGLKRGKWSAEEDEKLVSHIKANGEGSWRSLPKSAGLLRCGKSCRLRWINYLREDIKRGKFSAAEDETIVKLHKNMGNRWSLIASHLPGRTDNEIKNYWNSHLSRRIYSFRSIYNAHSTIDISSCKKKPTAHNNSMTQAPVAQPPDVISTGTNSSSIYSSSSCSDLSLYNGNDNHNCNWLDAFMQQLSSPKDLEVFMGPWEELVDEGALMKFGTKNTDKTPIHDDDVRDKGAASAAAVLTNSNSNSNIKDDTGNMYEACSSPIFSYFCDQVCQWDQKEELNLWSAEEEDMVSIWS